MKYEELFEYVAKKCDFKEIKSKKHKKDINWTCFNDLRFVKEFCKANNLNFKKIEKRLRDTGGYCDCEIIFNSIEQMDENEVLN